MAKPDNIGRKIEAGYLLRESFTQAPRGKGSGWRYENFTPKKQAPRGLVYDCAGAGTAMCKRFLKQEGKFTVDFRMTPSGENLGSFIAVKNGDEEIAALDFSRDILSFMGAGGEKVKAGALPENQTAGIRLDFRLAEGEVDIWVEGKIALKNQPLTGKARAADTICFGSAKQGAADYVINGIEIYKGFALYESLYNTASTNALPENWNAECDKGAVCESHAYAPMAHGTQFSVFRLNNGSNGGACRLESGYQISGSGVYQFDFFLEKPADGFEASFEGESGLMKFYSEAGDLCFKTRETDKGAVVIKGIRGRVWYRIQAELDAQSKKIAVSTNGFEAYAAGIGEDLAKGAFGRIAISAPCGAGEVMADRICIKPMLKRREVPKPEAPDTGELTVQMQVCTLWREGTHSGWRVYDDANAYPERKPLLGWYDESDPEVADWEIKWVLEHGIKSFMYCWYRPTGAGLPVKQGMLEDQLWDGYFNSAFKNGLKFSIMFTNHSGFYTSGGEDLLENVMPYFIETFFKNPNYLKTADNKPILQIFEVNELFEHINGGKPGEAADIKAMFDKMREMTVEAGFGGLVILAQYSGGDVQMVKKIAKCGYDYCYAYTWFPPKKGISNGEMLDHIKQTLNAQKKIFDEIGGPTRVIPNVSVSWDPTAWYADAGNEPGNIYTFDLAHLEALMEWVRDDFGAPEIDGAGTKIVMMDNWNEFGEGHFFMPTYGIPAYKGGKAGFGYLDCIRKVFGEGEFEHEDIAPLEQGFGPYDKWYPPAWDQAHSPENCGVFGL